jgi:hypothetical protein
MKKKIIANYAPDEETSETAGIDSGFAMQLAELREAVAKLEKRVSSNESEISELRDALQTLE